jgi:hypothetical protein
MCGEYLKWQERLILLAVCVVDLGEQCDERYNNGIVSATNEHKGS